MPGIDQEITCSSSIELRFAFFLAKRGHSERDEATVKNETRFLNSGFKIFNRIKEIIKSHGGSPTEPACAEIQQYISSLPRTPTGDGDYVSQWASQRLFLFSIGLKNWLEADTAFIAAKMIRYSFLVWAVRSDLKDLMDKIAKDVEPMPTAERPFAVSNSVPLGLVEHDWIEEKNKRPTPETKRREHGMLLFTAVLRKWALSYEGRKEGGSSKEGEDSGQGKGTAKKAIQQEYIN